MKTLISRIALGGLAAALVTASTGWAQCPAADVYEDNDDCANAVVLANGTYTNLTANGVANVGGEDPDFYEVTVPAGEILQVDCLHFYLNGDIDTYLYDAASPTCGDQLSYLVRGYNSADDETWTWANTTGAAATYIVEIDPWDSDTLFDCNDYTLVISTYPDPCASPVDDGFEENDTCAAAAPLASGAHSGNFVSDLDEDYYTINVPAAEILTVDVSYFGSTDVDIELFDDLACTNQVDFSFSFNGAGTVEWSNTTGAAATVVLRAAVDTATGTCNNYDLNVVTAPDPCLNPLADDGLEDNDTCGAAVALASGSHTGLFVSVADEDYYTVSVPAGEILTVDVSYLSTTDVDIELFDDLACTNSVDFSFSFGGTGTVEWSNSTGAAATVVLRALPDSFTGDCNDYDLNVVTAPDPCLDPLADDFLEDNDTCAAAVPMVDGLTTGLFCSKADEDFYSVQVADGDMLTVDILSPVVPGDIDVYLYDDQILCGDITSYLVRGYTSTDNETISWSNTTGSLQTYYIQVVVWASSPGDCNDYDMQITGSGGSVATPMCAGDGSVAPCPCGNQSAIGSEEGCINSLSIGAKIVATGTASVANDDLSFSLSQAIPSQPSLLLQGTGVISVAFKDGLLCMGNPTERVEVVFLDASGAGSTVESIVTNGAVLPGQTRHYQFWYRNPGGVSPCGTGSNFSAGATVIWQ